MSSSLLLPESADCLAQLGEPIAEFRPGKLRLLVLAALSVGALIPGLYVSIAWLAMILWLLFDPMFANARGTQVAIHLALIGLPYVFVLARPQNARMARYAHLGHLFGVGLIFLVASMAGWQRLRQTRGLRVLVFPCGLARIRGDMVDAIRWAEVATVTRAVLWEREQESFLDGAIRFTLVANDSRKFVFDEFLPGLRELRRHVERYTLPHLFPPLLDTLMAGRAVSFGQLTVHRMGLAYGGSALPWALCKSVEVVKGRLIVRRTGAWFAFCDVPLREVPNAHVLLALTEYVRRYAS